MQPERIQIAVRSRRAWEAIDLGFHMVRAWWIYLYGAWIALAVPALALWIYVFWSAPLWMLFGMWWLKPLLERLPLYVLSEALFGAPPRPIDALRDAPRWLRGGSLASLTWLRLTPARSMVLPVLQLEGLRGARRARRTRLIVGRDSSHALWLLLSCSIFQAFPVVLGLAGMALMFMPKDVGLLDAAQDLLALDAQDQRLYVIAIAYAVSLSCVEPLYVAGGFALYINRRIFLEGWDIELVFRKLARRARSKSDARSAALRTASAALIAILAFAPASGDAQEQDDPFPCRIEQPSDASRCIDFVLEDRVFGARETRTHWAPKWDPDAALDPDPASPGLGLEILSRLLQALVWILVAVGVVMLALYARKLRLRTGPASASDESLPEESALRIGAIPAIEPLPQDFVPAARRAFARGDAAGALSLLYRGALACVSRQGVEVPASATEFECARRVRSVAPAAIAEDFDALVRAWQLCAYGSRPPAPDAFDRLCERWQGHAQGAPA